MNLHAEIIDLASEGYFYPEASPLSSGKLNILPITAAHEELLANADLMKRGILTEQFISSVVDGGVNYNDLLECDRQSILLNLRIANYGAHSKVQTACNECDTEFEHDVSFGFSAKIFDFSKYERGVNKLSYTFPRCKKTVYYRLGTCSDYAVYESDGWLKYAKRVTLKIDDVDDIDNFYDYELSAIDSKYFRGHCETHTPGYLNHTIVTCTSCKKQRETKIPVDLNIFGIRPESKLVIHGEIFDLCYYSNGAFTQEGVYKMPTSLRSFYIKKLLDTKKAELEAQKNAGKGDSPNSKLAKPPKVKA